jgi:hypothetical protein
MIEPTTYSVGWFALSVINAGLAQSKNRSGFGWWALSLPLGPVATLLIVLSPRLEPGEPERVNGRFVLVGAIAVIVVLALILIGLAFASSRG